MATVIDFSPSFFSSLRNTPPAGGSADYAGVVVLVADWRLSGLALEAITLDARLAKCSDRRVAKQDMSHSRHNMTRLGPIRVMI